MSTPVTPSLSDLMNVVQCVHPSSPLLSPELVDQVG